MLNKLQNDPKITGWRPTILFILVALMMASLFFSRALLSLSMAAFVLVSFFHSDIKGQIRNFLSTPFLWSMSILFFLPLVSGFWSEDKEQWLNIVRIKLPLFILPLAFASPSEIYWNHFSKKMWDSLAFLFIALITAGTVWSVFQYAADVTAVHERYLQAKTIITPLNNDHVRFSWVITVALFLSSWFGIQKRQSNKLLAAFFFMISTWFIIFLHILAARTGLFSFYLGLFVLLFWLLLKKAKPYFALPLLVVAFSLPVVAYFVLPTFQNRVKYFLFDLTYFKDAHYLEGSNDAVRVISLKAGWNLMNEQPVKGVGFGDVLTETKKWYGVYYPQMLDSDKILPSSEWMMYGAASGWPGLILFTFILCIPFFISIKQKLLWWLLIATVAFSFLFDIGLEVQFGIFLYSFILLWWWKWLSAETT